MFDFDKNSRRLELKMKGLVACHSCDQPIHRTVKTCFHCGSTTKSENDIPKLSILNSLSLFFVSPTVKLAGRILWIVLGIVIIALVYYLDLLELIGL